jgi:UDP-N-acetylglucosamine 2-epimerase (non-hydrolysing)
MGRAQVVVVTGTRPESVKLAPLVLALRRSGSLYPVVVTTGQHGSLASEALAIFGIAADADLAVARAGSGLDAMAAAVLSRFGALVRADRPTAVVVQGDTTSALGAALGAFYHHIPVAHLEAGLRSGDRQAPFPEEVHRRTIALLADLHFAPTPAAAQRLVAEGTDPSAVHLTGNTVVDALRMIRGRQLPYRDPRLAALHAGRSGPGRRVMLVTAHRRESWGDPLDGIARAVELIARPRPDLIAVVAMHPNPVVRAAFAPLAALQNVLLIEPEPYGSFVRLMERADLILTDSGGIQEEAPSLGTPVLVLREVTERTEGIQAGVARMVGTDTSRIVAEAGALLDDPGALAAMTEGRDLYGDGHAAGRCLAALAAYLQLPPG